jgi:uncharacterized protein YbaA (DUF1428 family)
MTCIQGFVGAVPTANRAAFIDHARTAAEAFRDMGLVAAAECWGDDIPPGELTSFPLAVQARPDETVIFSWYRWPSKAVHDAAMAQPSRRSAPEPRDEPDALRRHARDLRRLRAGAGTRRAHTRRLCRRLRRPGEAGAPRGVSCLRRGCDPIFMEHGASWIMEAWGIDVPEGRVTDFRRAVQADADEEVVFSWVQWPDRAARDAGNARIMNDPRLADKEMPFDGSRLIFGGFTPLVEV